MSQGKRQVHFVAFLQAQNCTTLPASWRHPDARTDAFSPEYYQHIARVLEAGKFDLVMMGSHGHSALGNLVMGSVATRVLAHCKTPVLLVR